MTRPVLMRPLSLALAVGLAAGTGCSKSPELPSAKKEALLSYLAETAVSPEDYIVSKFADHDLVILGEFYRIKEDVDFVNRLIPRLYSEGGVSVIAIEFATSEDQAKIDSLFGKVLFDGASATAIQRRFSGGMWPYSEYLQIYQTVWDLDRSLQPDAERFRVIALSPFVDWAKINHGTESEAQAERQRVTQADTHMAQVLEREVLSKGLKALVYCGIRHAFTRFKEPVARDGEFVRSLESRMGNLLRRRLGARVMTVALHSPWPGPRREQLYRPCDGNLDRVLDEYGRPVGFDVPGGPFGELGDTRSVYGLGPTAFTLGDFCDGYVYQKPLADLTGVSLIGSWISSPEAFEEAKRNVPMREFGEQVKSIRDFMGELQRSAGIPTQFENLK